MRPDGRRVKATLHWVSAAHAVPVEVRLYDRLFSVEDPEQRTAREKRFSTTSTRTRSRCCAAPRPSRASRRRTPGTRVQFERLGYFCVDIDSRPGALVFNRTVSLRDTWARIAQKTAS